jgi:chitinase
MAVSANPGTLKWLGNDLLLETMDWINVMTYDYAGDWTSYAGHNSPLHASSKQPGPTRRSVELTINYLLETRGFPANRIAMGIPLYGRGFAAPAPYAPKRQPGSTPIPRGSYNNLNKLYREANWAREWDDETKTPWLISPDGTVVVGYDDADSVSIKTAWAMQKGLRGVFFWQIAADRMPDGSNPLQEASRKQLDKTR